MRVMEAADTSFTPEGIWAWLQEQVDPARYRPAAAPGVLVQQLADRTGPYYMLRNPAARTSHRLDERDYSLWQLMDGGPYRR